MSQFERSPNDTTVDKAEEIQGEETENGKEEGRVVDGEQSEHIEFLKKLDLKVMGVLFIFCYFTFLENLQWQFELFYFFFLTRRNQLIF